MEHPTRVEELAVNTRDGKRVRFKVLVTFLTSSKKGMGTFLTSSTERGRERREACYAFVRFGEEWDGG